MTSRYATLLLTREMFCGAAVATLIGLGLGAWMTPTVQQGVDRDPDPYASFVLNAPPEPAVQYGARASAASWTRAPPAVTEAEPEPVAQRIDWQADAALSQDGQPAPQIQEPSPEGGQQDADSRDGPPAPLKQ